MPLPKRTKPPTEFPPLPLWSKAIIVFLVGGFLSVTLAICAGKCGDAKRHDAQPNATKIPTGFLNQQTVITFRHDGHDFIKYGISKSGFFLHHPDCPCRQ